MRYRPTLLALLTATFIPTAAHAQSFSSFITPLSGEPDRNPNELSALMSEMNERPNIQRAQSGECFDLAITSIRGGNGSNKQLGCYNNGQQVVFTTPYKDLDDGTKAAFAYDLERYRQLRHASLSDFGYGKRLAYNQIKDEFADMWWRRHYEPYKNMFQQDKFLQEALLDATQLEGWYQRKLNPSVYSVAWLDAELCVLIRKQ